MAERDNLTAHKSKRHHFLKRSLHLFLLIFFFEKKIFYAESHSKGPTPYLSKEYSTQCA